MLFFSYNSANIASDNYHKRVNENTININRFLIIFVSFVCGPFHRGELSREKPICSESTK